MISQIDDVRAEAAELAVALRPLADREYEHVTGFKGYTINDVVRHLHQGDYMGFLSATNADSFRAWYAGRQERRARGVSARDDARLQFGHLAGSALLDQWQKGVERLCTLLAAKPADTRLVWGGPDMGLRMFATARQMEIWAHGQEIYDVLGLSREPTDRLKNIATIGVRTFQWTFANRKLRAPADAPYVRLVAPSGGIWEWNEFSATNAITGPALDFCQVVTQVRNVADTQLAAVGETSRSWMAIAQCFAGPPETPPPPGTRIKAHR